MCVGVPMQIIGINYPSGIAEAKGFCLKMKSKWVTMS